MATKAVSPAKRKNSAAPKPAAAKAARSARYQVVLREAGGTKLTAEVEDRVLYPKAVAWNRRLSSDRGRLLDQAKEAKAWRESAHAAILDLAEAGAVSRKKAAAFIKAAAKSGMVQVEMEWRRENEGWAARVFPWEALLALATKEARKKFRREDFMVVRVLTGGAKRTLATGNPAFAVSEGAEMQGFDTTTERAAIEAALQTPLETLAARSLAELAAEVKRHQPAIIHLVLNSAEKGAIISAKDKDQPEEALTEKVAEAVASQGAEITVFSSCYTGRRLAPLAVAHGATVAIGFHGEVMDASIPVFFGAFYRAWKQGLGPVGALRAGLAANKCQSDPGALGTVTLWSATDLISGGLQRKQTLTATAKFQGTGDGGVVQPADIRAALPVTCELEDALNYSVLQNSRGGLFKVFTITKIKEGAMEDVEVSIKLDTGLDRPAECHFFASLPNEADRQQDLALQVTLPLGSQLLRQRGESLLGTVEITILCGKVPVFHRLRSIKLLPCDEWRDDVASRHFLPSFVFPRDPAVREILSASQPFLRALCDQPQAGFDGYQCGFDSDPDEAVAWQTRAIWAALQYTMRLDYANPPPTYTNASQRIRTPEEILRAHRGTCIELALLLASCWEHVGIFPVIFLTSGHSFAGYWTSEKARSGFIEGLTKPVTHAIGEPEAPGAGKIGGSVEIKKAEPWMFAEAHHLAAIRDAVRAARLMPVEATFIPLQRSFANAVIESKRLLEDLRGTQEFDGMIDVQSARERGVTPLAIIAQGVVA